MTLDTTLPERMHDSDGNIRQVGIELEFAGLELGQICRLIVDLYGGRHIPTPRFAHRVEGTPWGTFVVAIDTAVLKDQDYLKVLEPLGLDLPSLQRVEDLLGRIAGTLVPHEIACPPVPFDRIDRIERLRESLQQHHALGTRAALRYAFGLHFNPQTPATDVDTLLAYLRAFLVLVDQLKIDGEVDLSRRITPFINDFPQSYIRKVLARDYRPEIGQLIDDYLSANPTRNRPLDMLPLFAHIDYDRVRAGLEHELGLVKPRPTFHYRLPNCLIDDPNWSIGQEWRGWVLVENLAARPAAIDQLSQAYLQYRHWLTLGADEHWAQYTRDWLASL